MKPVATHRWDPRDIDWDDPWAPSNPEFGEGEVLVGYDGSIADMPLEFRHGSLAAVDTLLSEVGAFFTYGLVVAGEAMLEQIEDEIRAGLRNAPCEGRWTDHDLLVLSRFGWIEDELRNIEYQPQLGFWDNRPAPFKLTAPALEVRDIGRTRGPDGGDAAAEVCIGVTGEAPTVALTIALIDYSTLERSLRQSRVYVGGGALITPDGFPWETTQATIVDQVGDQTVERDWIETMAKLSRFGRVSDSDLQREWWRAPAR